MRKNEDAFNVQLDINAVFVVWLPMKQKRMADNGWMYSGRVSVTNRSPEWIWKTQMLVKELARVKRIPVVFLLHTHNIFFCHVDHHITRGDGSFRHDGI